MMSCSQMMGFFKFLFCFLFFFLLFTTAFINGKNICRASSCGNTIFPVKFPFRLQDQQQPTNCGYPGFDLGCIKQGIVTLKLPQSEELFMRSINYVLQEIRLYDPSGCLANRLRNLNLSGSPFTAASYTKFSILTCSSGFSSSNSISVGCLSNLTNTVLAVPSDTTDLHSPECQKLFDQPISVPRSPGTAIQELGDDDIPLNWNVPDCRYCESRDEMCGFADHSSRLIVCLDRPRTASSSVRILGLISASISFCVFLIVFFICFTKARRMCRRRQLQNSDSVGMTQPPVNAVAGLDENTIQSYTKVVLGESLRLPGITSDGTCPICLSVYNAKDTVKSIPECQHCFHAECIDEWLRIAGTCPTCRKTSPSPLPTTRAS